MENEMENEMDTVTDTLPTNWLVALFDGDLSSYDGQEIEQLEHFTHYMRKNHGSAIPLDYANEADTFFTQWHDAMSFGVLACEVVDILFEHNPPTAAATVTKEQTQ